MRRAMKPGPRTVLLKTCGGCGETLPGDKFAKGGSRQSRRRLCLPCEYQHRVSTPEKRKEAQRRAQQATDEAQERTQRNASNSRIPWTETDVEFLQIGLDAGMTHAEIATDLGRTLRSIQSKAWVLAHPDETLEVI